MSVYANSLVAVAAIALGVTVDASASPIVESMLNDVAVSSIGAAEINVKGKCIVIATVNSVARPVADSTGNVKLFRDGAAVVALAKHSNLPSGQAVTIVKMASTAPVGDPISALKSRHKQAVKEAAQAHKPLADLAQKITAAEQLGWQNDPAGSATKAEYDDLQKRKTTVQEWADDADARVTTLAAALTTAGIDPTTYLPIH